MEKHLQEIVDFYQVQGIIAVAFDKNGEILAEKTHGYRDVSTKEIINRDTIFGIASMSKSFTALALIQLVEKGIVSLDDPVEKYIPELQNDKQSTVRIRHLLSHSAGYFPQHRTTVYEVAQTLGIDVRNAPDLAYDENFAQAGIKEITNLLNQQQQFCGAPGERLSYSNDSYGLLTEIISRFGGEATYAAYVEKYIFEPLNMMRTTVGFKQLTQEENVTKLYYKDGDELKTTTDFYDNAFVLMGGGAIKSTINDLIKYVCFYLNKNNEVVLSIRGIDAMTTPYILFTLDSDYGFGLSIEKIGDYAVIGHGGSLTGVSSQMLWIPEKEIGVIVLCNTSDVPVSLIAKKILCDTAEIEQPEKKHVQVEWTKAELLAICGVYQSDEGDKVEVLLELDELTIKVNDVKKSLLLGEQNIIYLQNKFNMGALLFYPNEKQEIFAVKLGGGILPKCL